MVSRTPGGDKVEHRRAVEQWSHTLGWCHPVRTMSYGTRGPSQHELQVLGNSRAWVPLHPSQQMLKQGVKQKIFMLTGQKGYVEIFCIARVSSKTGNLQERKKDKCAVGCLYSLLFTLGHLGTGHPTPKQMHTRVLFLIVNTWPWLVYS